jgi:hypothetical protein
VMVVDGVVPDITLFLWRHWVGAGKGLRPSADAVAESGATFLSAAGLVIALMVPPQAWVRQASLYTGTSALPPRR